MLASTTKLSGRSPIGFREGAGNMEPHYSTGQRLEPGFISATSDEVDLAARLAAEAFEVYRRVSGRDRGAFLRTIASKIEVIAGEIVERAGQETALPAGCLQAEAARTCNQLRVFAQVAEDWSWFNARIDRERHRQPTPRPDIRSMLHPPGPAVVFGASNFPLAFSVAGGDTASALAGLNTVIVKARAAHPRTSELVGRAAQQAVRECGLPEGVFSVFFESGPQIRTALMKHPLVKEGFTGSRVAGRILMDVAAARPEPIPFPAEMSSTNAVFISPGALRERGESIAETATTHGTEQDLHDFDDLILILESKWAPRVQPLPHRSRSVPRHRCTADPIPRPRMAPRRLSAGMRSSGSRACSATRDFPTAPCPKN